MAKYKSKELPLGEPPVKCFLYEAYPLSILSVKEEFKSWFYSNYIQLCCYQNFVQRDEVFLEFFGPDQALHSPYLKTQYLSWEAFPKDTVHIVDYVVSNIDQDYYFYCYVDEYYISNRISCGKDHCMHDLFIYGYDEEEKAFMVLGYDNFNHFEKSMVSYKDFQKAFLHNDADKILLYWTDRIYLLKYDTTAKYEFDIQCLIDLTENYLESGNSDERDRRYHNPVENKVFGIKTYDCLITYYELLNFPTNIIGEDA